MTAKERHSVEEFQDLFSQKAATGIPGLDRILYGGITRTNSLLIEGAPGSGKSTLGVQMLVRGAELYEEPGVMVAFEEFPRQLFSEYASYGFDLKGLEEKGLLRIIWTDPRKVIQSFSGKDDLIGRIIDDMGAKRLLIDSITHFRRVAGDDIDLRELLYQILNNLKLKGVNSLLVKELEGTEDRSIAFEEYVVDASLRIVNNPSNRPGEARRTLQIRKSRGQKHISGEHPFEFKEDGIHVFPHLRPEDIVEMIEPRELETGRKPTGVSGFDELIEDGFLPGSLNVMVGYSGTGKTTLARHFVHSRMKEAREKVLVVTFQETAEEFMKYSKSLGLDLDGYREEGRLDFWSLSPIGVIPEKFMADFFEWIHRGNYTALVWDCINDLQVAIQDTDRLRETYHLIALLLRRAGVTTILLNQAGEMSGLIRLTEQDFVELADSVTQFSFAESNATIHRFLGVMKMTGTDHSKDLHEFKITSDGMVVKKKATGLSGILSGRTQGHLEAVADQVMSPLSDASRTLRKVIDTSDLTDSSRERLTAAREKLGVADIVLREHFGISEIADLLSDLDLPDLE